VVRMDPRVKTPEDELAQQFAAGRTIVDLWRRDSTAIAGVRAMRAVVDSLKKAAGAGPRADSLTAFDEKLAALLSGGGIGGRRGGGAPAAAAPAAAVPGPGGRPGAAAVPESNLLRLAGELGGLYGIVEGHDSAPTSQVVMSFFNLQRSFQETLGRWDALRQEGAGLGVAGR